MVHLFVNLLLNDEANKTCTGLRIMYCQIACHFVYYASEYVQDISTKVQSYRLRAIASFVWPCVTSNLNVVDLQEKYTGLQVLAYLIARFYPIMGKATPQVFLCLAKGPQTEVKKMVNPSLDLLLPAWVTGLEEQIPVDQRRMILDLIEVTVRWDMKCKSERAALEQQQEQQSPNQNASSSAGPSSIGGPVSPSLVHFND
ncbi:unnamed protein product [Hydatigera taeniaeformis]|uniref:Uncharacterized protein n=1 Tax=Hydatigena taeniaeformis TaxID=6205 RepID=A0A3P7FA90_HYDTA|nr:unnamed protein product [Hydatigera taeniaeformis]